MVLGFSDIPDEEDRPPENIWGDDERLIEWFQSVKARHDAKYSKDDMEEVPMMQNEIRF